MKRITGWALVLVLTFLALPLHADLESAKAAYQRGAQLEQAKQYNAAITEYQSALAAEPRYAYAWKQIGNCRYYLGDKAGALQAYDEYLAVVKTDAKTQAFTDRLRAEAPAPAAAAAVTGAVAVATRWRAGLDFGYHTLSFSQWNEDWKSVPASSGSTYPTIDSGLSLGATFGYRVIPKLDLGLDIDYYIVGTSLKATASGGGISYESSTTYNFDAIWIGPSVGYDLLQLSNGLTVNGGLALGWFSLMGAGSDGTSTYTFYGISSSSSSKSTYSGSSLGTKAKLGLSWKASALFTATLDVGYRIASIPKISYSSSNTSGSTTVTSTGTLSRFGATSSGDLALDYSGLDLRLGAELRF